jgi:Holliday junction DNA helicase RuvB
MLEIDHFGLSLYDRKILETIINKFGGGPVGLGTLSISLSEEGDTIEEVHEPYLIQLGLLERTPRGRIATKAAYDHLGFDVPKNLQEKLL